jgi:hypothetical protein
MRCCAVRDEHFHHNHVMKSALAVWDTGNKYSGSLLWQLDFRNATIIRTAECGNRLAPSLVPKTFICPLNTLTSSHPLVISQMYCVVELLAALPVSLIDATYSLRMFH